MKKLNITTITLGSLLLASIMPANALAKKAGDLLVRGRAVVVAPDASATIDPIGGTVDINTKVIPELDFTYFLTDNIGIELILATTKHNPVAVDTAAGNIELGSVWLLPPTVTLQYHFNPKGLISPYVGAGINYTFYYSESSSDAINDINYTDGFGYALQAGVDIKIDEKWSFNVDVKRVWLNTDVSINGGSITADVDIDPWLIGVGFGYTF